MKYLVDTNLLVLLIVGLTDSAYIAKHKNTRNEYGIEEFERLRRLLESASAVMCTAHVLTETSNLLRQCAEPMRSHIMHHLAIYIGTAEEMNINAREVVKSQSFLRLGLTDTAIASIDDRSLCVLTVDAGLYIECARTGVNALNLTPVLYD